METTPELREPLPVWEEGGLLFFEEGGWETEWIWHEVNRRLIRERRLYDCPRG